MSIMHFDAMPAAAAQQGTVSLNGSNINVVGGFSYSWGWQFTTSGLVYEYHNGSNILIDSGSDWITPRTSFTAADYEVRGWIFTENCTQTKTTFGSNAFISDQPSGWYGLGTTRTYRFKISTNFDNEFCIGSIRYEIRNITTPSQNTQTSQNDGTTPIITDGVYQYYIEIGFE